MFIGLFLGIIFKVIPDIDEGYKYSNKVYTNEDFINNTKDFCNYDVPHCDGTQPTRCWVYENESFDKSRQWIKHTYPESDIVMINYITKYETE